MNFKMSYLMTYIYIYAILSKFGEVTSDWEIQVSIVAMVIIMYYKALL